MTDQDCTHRPHTDYAANYFAAADAGNWNLCRMICNSMGCGPDQYEPSRPNLSRAERTAWGRMYELADKPGNREKKWRQMRATLANIYPPPSG